MLTTIFLAAVRMKNAGFFQQEMFSHFKQSQTLNIENNHVSKLLWSLFCQSVVWLPWPLNFLISTSTHSNGYLGQHFWHN